MSRFQVRGIYPIVDVEACRRHGVAPLDLAMALCSQRPGLIQLRAKAEPAGEVLRLLTELRALSLASKVALVVNDRPDLAQMCGADAVHVGQDDLPIHEVRRFDPTLAVGLSTHSLEQLDRALSCRPDYVALGPVFATSSKADPDPVLGPDVLGVARGRCRDAGVPLVAIGGISESALGDVDGRCDAAAVIGALFEAGSSRSALERQFASLHANFASSG